MRVLLLFSVFLFSVPVSAQEISAVKFRREKGLVFFQLGAKSDTIVKGSGDLFYLSMSDSLKSRVSVYVENGRLEYLSGDTLFRVAHLPGLAYESRYYAVEDTSGVERHEFHTLVNGASTLMRNTLQIRVVNRMTGMIIENRYYFKD